ncbi:MAG: hypothetical protein PVF76_02845 [Syntrophobacterales bacterium]|jgi:hypothetical protein
MLRMAAGGHCYVHMDKAVLKSNDAVKRRHGETAIYCRLFAACCP